MKGWSLAWEAGGREFESRSGSRLARFISFPRCCGGQAISEGIGLAKDPKTDAGKALDRLKKHPMAQRLPEDPMA